MTEWAFITVSRFLARIPEPWYPFVRRLANAIIFMRNPEREVCLGPLNPDKTLYLVRDTPPSVGVAGWYDRMLGYLERAEKKGWILVIDEEPPVQPDSGTWRDYFAFPSGITAEEARRSAHVVRANVHGVVYKRFNKRNINKRHRLSASIPLSRFAQQYVDARLHDILGNICRPSVGVMFRGTDYRVKGGYCPVGHAKVPRMETFCRSVEADLTRWGIPIGNGEHLFVVTEEQEALDAIRQRFPACHFVLKERFSNFQQGKYLAYHRLPHTSPLENNYLYLLDIAVLAQCDYLIGGVNGCTIMSLVVNGNKYKGVDIQYTGIN